MAQFKNRATQPDDPAILIVPGLGGSGPSHWQSRWADEIADSHKVDLGEFHEPHRNTWINRLNLAIYRASRPVVLVAHSLGCHLTAWWAKFEQTKWCDPVVGALLVAPPEVDFFPLDDRLSRFSPTPSEPLPFPSILIASRNDPYISHDTSKLLAKSWNSYFVDAGEAGHLNADSHLGNWEFGRSMLGRLLGTVQRRPASPLLVPQYGHSTTRRAIRA